MFAYLTSTILIAIATYMISKKFGWWAGLVVAGMHIISLTVDHFVVGNLTTFRQLFYSVYAFLLLVAYYKTIHKLNL